MKYLISQNQLYRFRLNLVKCENYQFKPVCKIVCKVTVSF